MWQNCLNKKCGWINKKCGQVCHTTMWQQSNNPTDTSHPIHFRTLMEECLPQDQGGTPGPARRPLCPLPNLLTSCSPHPYQLKSHFCAPLPLTYQSIPWTRTPKMPWGSQLLSTQPQPLHILCIWSYCFLLNPQKVKTLAL